MPEICRRMDGRTDKDNVFTILARNPKKEKNLLFKIEGFELSLSRRPKASSGLLTDTSKDVVTRTVTASYMRLSVRVRDLYTNTDSPALQFRPFDDDIGDEDRYNFYLLSKTKEKLREKWLTDAKEAVTTFEKAVEATRKCEWAKCFTQ
ncbi:hypothetical protein EVAR_21225_1 [Eumeta japonica]|uniref:Uncharacterized protein n=1 Tax=Eumeta variegata TaxID=151549 RepID=A0A4C1UNR4_EUMVA|nr:hypothetical protein EVAR_21225_1 [Eumeta japonica]